MGKVFSGPQGMGEVMSGFSRQIQKNQQEPTHSLPNQHKSTTFAKQRNKKNTTEKAENPQESRLKQISIFK